MTVIALQHCALSRRGDQAALRSQGRRAAGLLQPRRHRRSRRRRAARQGDRSREDWDSFVTASRALDRVLRAKHFWVPQWNKADALVRLLGHVRRGRQKAAHYDPGVLDTWWFDAEKAAQIGKTGLTPLHGRLHPPPPPADDPDHPRDHVRSASSSCSSRRAGRWSGSSRSCRAPTSPPPARISGGAAAISAASRAPAPAAATRRSTRNTAARRACRRNSSPSSKAVRLRQAGAMQRFLLMIWNYARFDFGESYFRDVSVLSLIAREAAGLHLARPLDDAPLLRDLHPARHPQGGARRLRRSTSGRPA